MNFVMFAMLVLVGVLAGWLAGYVRYVRADPVNGPAEGFIEIYPASRSGRI
jgi:hypothetical protein